MQAFKKKIGFFYNTVIDFTSDISGYFNFCEKDLTAK